ncbi:glycoside hydrolase family 28 protein [Flavisolibacter tropicus]|uniref:Glycoside hydrolase family protein n=1 Tax=Flavisolibacter tropicus TaxID=1492898 RepID=A0A172TWL8_9BACT|nr:glycosyl hydrolase family 28 protein [Flavisolibacter tropicus]ANE51485.1 glycoside hydrolase family protein [Flavisolibacter tropicus]
MRSSLLGIVLLLAGFGARAEIYDVTSFGAKGDATSDNAAFIQRAIDSCTKTGGKVYFPAGTFLTGTLVLKSNVVLSLSSGAIIMGHTDLKKYPYQDGGIRFYGELWARQSLIFCKGQENVGIEGLGTIDGQGAMFPVTTTVKPDRYKNRPYLLWFVGCKNVSVKDVQLRNSAFWMQHYLGCEYVLIDGVKIWNHSNKNNDMMDIDGSKYVRINNVTGDSDDDGITIKSTSTLVSENITITNCIVSSHCNAIKFGTESTGGFRNVTIDNCVIKPSKQTTTIYGRPAGISGISLEVVDGGIMENIAISNIVIEGPQVPLFMRLGNRARKHIDEAAEPQVGKIKNVTIANIIATGADTIGCSFSGIDGYPIEGISLSNISIETSGGGTTSEMYRTIEAKEKDYPEAYMFGHLPAYGFYISNANDVKLSDIKIRSKAVDYRPGVAITKTELFSLSGIDAQSSNSTDAVIYITNSNNGSIKNSTKLFPFRRYILKDKTSKNISND